MSIEIVLLSCLAYILGAIGYIVTIIKCSEGKINDKVILVLLGMVWPVWLILLGLAYILSTIDEYKH